MKYSRQQIEEEVLNAFSSYSGNLKSQVSLEDDISADLGLDSLDRYEVMIELEKKFDTDVLGEDIVRANTVSDFVDLLEKDLEKRQ